MKELKVGLVAGRHEMPVKEYIFNSIPDVLDFEALSERAIQFWSKHWNCDKVVIYVTGLTSAVLAVVDAWLELNVGSLLSFMHYDRETATYKEQAFYGSDLLEMRRFCCEEEA